MLKIGYGETYVSLYYLVSTAPKKGIDERRKVYKK